jgi:hypothetical protein
MFPSSYHSPANQRLQFRLWQMNAVAVTIAATSWCATVGPIPAIIAIVTAKHVLVVLLVAGIDHEQEEESEQLDADSSWSSLDY